MPRGAHTRPPIITPQQKRAVELFKQNTLGGTGKSVEAILLEAGYSEESAKQQTNVMAGIRPHLQPFMERMIAHREAVLSKMEERIDKADYADLTRALDKLTHNIQLLGGKPTGNVILTDARRAELEELIDG